MPHVFNFKHAYNGRASLSYHALVVDGMSTAQFQFLCTLLGPRYTRRGLQAEKTDYTINTKRI